MQSPLQGGRLLIGLAAAGAALAVGGVAYAAIPGATGNYTACLSRTSGVLRLIDPSRSGPPKRRSHCLSGEQRITWSRTGAPGRTGATSPSGAAGAAGTLGLPGVAGVLGAIGPAGGPGATGATGPSGATGTTGPAAVSAFSGHVVAVPTTGPGAVGVTFGAPTGVSSSGSPETTVETFSPSVPITFEDLDAAKVGAAVPTNDQIDVSVSVNGSSTISCVITPIKPSCDSGSQSASIPAGSTVSIRVETDTTLGAEIFPYDLLFGFTATTS